MNTESSQKSANIMLDPSIIEKFRQEAPIFKGMTVVSNGFVCQL
jgi:hypothetical protein